MFRSCLRLFSLALILSLVSAAARAEFPDRPIHLVVPYPPGGLVDAMARTIQEPLSAILGQTLASGGALGANSAPPRSTQPQPPR